MRAFALLFLCLLLVSVDARAHPLAPALLSIETTDDGTFAVRWKLSRMRPAGSDVRPLLPAHCARLGEAEISVGPTDVTEAFRVDCGREGLIGQRLSVTGLDRSRTDALIHVRLADGRSIRGLVGESRPWFRVPERESALAVLRSYLRLGIEHLLGGLDHVLFVVGLLLLVSGWRRAVATISAFTVGHSITLSVAVLGFVAVPTRWFEFAIAASILTLGVELARDPGRASWLKRRPWAIAFGFGLLHGFGFAGALSQIGLPRDDIPLALFSFNLGVEVGQLIVIAPLAVALWVIGERTLRSAVTRVGAYAIGSLAAYWCIERAIVLW